MEFGTGIGLARPRAGQRRAGVDRGHRRRTTRCPRRRPRQRSASGRWPPSRSWASAAPGRSWTCSLAGAGRADPGLLKGMGDRRPLHRPAPLPAARRGSRAPRRGAARRGARVGPRLRDHHEPRRPHRRVQPGGGAHVRLSPGRRGGQAGRRRRDPRAAARRPPRRARAATCRRARARILGRRLELDRQRARTAAEFPVEVSIVRIGTEEPPMFAGYLRDVTRAQARRGEHPPAGRDRRALERRRRRRRPRRADPRLEPRRGAAVRVVRRRGDRHVDRRHRAAGPPRRDGLPRAPADGGQGHHEPPHGAPAQGRRARRRRAHAVADPRRGRRA